MTLSNKALLAHLTISQWTGRKFDKTATGTVESTHSTQVNVGNYTKKLLPAAKELQAIQSEANNMRAWFYEQTLPWCADGSRILSSKNYMDFTKEFNERKNKFDHAVVEFLREYPMLREAAREKLGDLFRESEYPSVAGLQTCFQCEIAFMPMPDVGDFRVEILDSEKEVFLNRMRDVEVKAMRDVWTRLHDVVSKAAAKLSAPDAIFRDSLLENVKDLCSLLPKLNVTDDASLESMRQSVEKTISSISLEDCRKNQDARTDAARALAQIESQMGSFMGSVR